MKPTTTPSANSRASDVIEGVRNKILDMAFFLAQGFAEIVQCALI